MAKRRKKARGKSSTKVSKTSFKAIKKLKKNGGACKSTATPSTSQPRSLKGRDARREERFRELVAWHMLEGMDEAAARLRAGEEMSGGR
jgi:hypothetical protein